MADKARLYTILQRQPLVFLDAGGGVVNGYRVRFMVEAVNEIHEIQSATLDADELDRAIRRVIEQIQRSAALGAAS